MIRKSIVAYCLVCFVNATHVCAQSNGISITKNSERVTVRIADQLFAEYDYTSFQKPVLYPLLAPGNVAISRHYPMRDDVSGEAKDHPHHKSVWFAHGDINGVDFWSEKGRIKCTGIKSIGGNRFTASHQWVSGESKSICTDETTMSFAYGNDWRSVDYHIVMRAEHGVVTFGDTKEGTFAVRTHPNLRLARKNNDAVGKAFNSAGIEGKAMWGKRAKWVYYFGQIDNATYGIAIMDHPSNLRHPTTWHARDYGLVAANPFGLHHFQQKTRGEGNYTIEAGDKLQFRYRILITKGNHWMDQVDQEFDKFSKVD